MHRVGGALEDDGVGELDAPGVAVRLDAGRARDRGRRPHQRAQWDRRPPTYRLEVAKAHEFRLGVVAINNLLTTRRQRATVGRPRNQFGLRDAL